MFTGIVEEVGEVTAIRKEGSNIHFSIQADFSQELQVDQSVAHDGVCLTVTELQDGSYTVCAIEETLSRTALGRWVERTKVNLERAMKLGGRLDGHMVQGHVDSVGRCTQVEALNGSWVFRFSHQDSAENITVVKGSICINGVSVTVVESEENAFSVAIIPYTFEHTNFCDLKKGDPVNLEFDVIGKYVARIMGNRV